MTEMRAELRAHTHVLNALRETQLEQGTALSTLRTEMTAELAAEIGSVRSEMRQGFATMHTGMAQITRLLEEISGG